MTPVTDTSSPPLFAPPQFLTIQSPPFPHGSYSSIDMSHVFLTSFTLTAPAQFSSRIRSYMPKKYGPLCRVIGISHVETNAGCPFIANVHEYNRIKSPFFIQFNESGAYLPAPISEKQKKNDTTGSKDNRFYLAPSCARFAKSYPHLYIKHQ